MSLNKLQGKTILAFLHENVQFVMIETATGSVCGLDEESATPTLNNLLSQLERRHAQLDLMIADLQQGFKNVNNARPGEISKALAAVMPRLEYELKRAEKTHQETVHSIEELRILLEKSKAFDTEKLQAVQAQQPDDPNHHPHDIAGMFMGALIGSAPGRICEECLAKMGDEMQNLAQISAMGAGYGFPPGAANHLQEMLQHMFGHEVEILHLADEVGEGNANFILPGFFPFHKGKKMH